MTNSSPQPPENESSNKPILDLDEKVAVIVAFLTIGSILFWSLGSGLRKGILSTSSLKSSFSGWTNSLLSSSKTTEQSEELSTEIKGNITNNFALNGELAGTVESEALEATSRNLNRLPQASENLDDVDAFTEPGRRSFGLAAPVAGSLTLGRGRVSTPEVPELEAEAPTPEVTPEVPELEAEAPTPKVTPEVPELEAPTPKVTPEVPELEAPTPKVTPEVPQIAFTDVNPDYWAYPFIKQLGTDKLILGDSKTQFEPDKLITRASMATLISQSFNQTPTKKTKNFTDMPSQKAIVADINQAVGTGFMQGYSDDEFRPLENIPRYQVLVTLATGLDLKPSQDANDILGKFDDTDSIPDWAKEQVAAATEAGLAVNRPEFSKNSLKPEEPATRAEVAAMIHQALVQSDKLESIDSEYIVKP